MRDEIQNIKAACRGFGLEYECISSGSFDSSIAIVSDYPGSTEAKTGLPFSGESGRYLWNILKRVGQTRGSVYCTNVIKRQTTGYKTSDNELRLWHSVLEIELNACTNLKAILALGSNPLKFFNGSGAITDWRGSVTYWNGIPVFYSYNPAYVVKRDQLNQDLEDPRREVIFSFDIAKFGQLLKGNYEPVEVKCEVLTDYMRAREVLRDLSSMVTTSNDPYENAISVDIEHLNGHTACVGLSNDGTTGIVLPFFDGTVNIWTQDQEFALRGLLASLLTKTCVIGQNFSTDAIWLWYKDGIRCQNIVGDTLLAHHLLYPSMPHNLGFLTSWYTWHPFYKDEGDFYNYKDDIKTYWEYNAKDTVNTYNIHRILLYELRREGLLDVYRNHVLRITPHLIRATVTGIPIDTVEKQRLEDEYTDQHTRDEADLCNFVIDTWGPELFEAGVEPDLFNPASTKQVSTLLHDVLHVPVHGRSTDKRTLEQTIESRIVDGNVRKLAEDLLNLRQSGKFLSTYARVKLDNDNVFRPTYKQFGTQRAPGRLSSEANQWGTASNIQNQPNKSRGMFITPPGYVFVYIDSAQAEARYVGWDAYIQSWIEEFEYARLNPGTFDCHRSLAGRIYDIPYDDVPHKDWNEDGTPTIRYLGKRARHGLNYRMQPRTFSEANKVALSVAHAVFTAYHKETPELAKWWNRLENEIRESKAKTGAGILYNSFGRRLYIKERLTRKTMESMVAFRPQSSIGDLLQHAWYSCHEDERWPTAKARILINVHDSLTAIAHEIVADTCQQLMIEHAEYPICVHEDQIPLIIPADAKRSVPDDKGIHRWSNLK